MMQALITTLLCDDMHDTCPHTYAGIERYTCCGLPRWSAGSLVPHPQTPRCRHRWCRYVPWQSVPAQHLVEFRSDHVQKNKLAYTKLQTHTNAQALQIDLADSNHLFFSWHSRSTIPNAPPLCEEKIARDSGSPSNLVFPHSTPDFARSFEPLRAEGIHKSPAFQCLIY